MNNDILQILTNFHNELSSCRGINDYIQLAKKYDQYENPYPFYYLASMTSNLGYEKDALNFYLKAISFGLEYPNKFWNTQLSDSIGSSVTHVIDKYKFDESIFELKKNLCILGYAYLSNCINIMGMNAVDSYFNRGLLISKKDKAIVEITHQYLNVAVLNQVMAISDFYNSSMGYKQLGHIEEAKNAFQNAIINHEWLEDISVNGKDADEYNIEEIAEIGRQRSNLLSAALIDELKSSRVHITLAQIQNEIHPNISY